MARMLLDLDIEYISLVREPANRKKRLVLKSVGEKAKVDFYVPFQKSNDEDMIVYGVVYSPGEVDAQGDFTTEEEIKKAAWNFMKSGRVWNVDVEHTEKRVPAYVAESWLSKGGDPLFPDEPANTWIVGVKVEDEGLWTDIKKGKYQGFSMAGVAKVQEVEKSGDTYYVSRAKTDWPIAPSDTPWDPEAAKDRILQKGGWELLAQCVAVIEFKRGEKGLPEAKSRYSFPFCDVVNGKVMIIPKAVSSGIGYLNGARGVKIDPAKAKVARPVLEKIHARIEREKEKEKMGKSLKDEIIKALKDLLGIGDNNKEEVDMTKDEVLKLVDERIGKAVKEEILPVLKELKKALGKEEQKGDTEAKAEQKAEASEVEVLKKELEGLKKEMEELKKARTQAIPHEGRRAEGEDPAYTGIA